MGVEEVSHQATDISNALSEIEGRLLRLVKEMEQEQVSLEDFIRILSGMLAELKGWNRRVIEQGELRTVTFRTVRLLRELDETAVYLYRKIHFEKIFFVKLALERKLRSLVSTEAFDVYQELLDVAECEKALSARSDAEVRLRLSRRDARSPPLDPV